MKSVLSAGCLLMLLNLLQMDANAQQQRLKIGMSAPGLDVMKWAKGKPVSKFEKGRYYIVEFTGIGCPPCRKAMPHLSQIAKKYKKMLTVISIFDGTSDTGEPDYMNMFNALLSEYGNNMQYTIAIDKPGKVTQNLWLTYGVPAVYLIDTEGNIVWMGHPDSLDRLMEHMVAGTLKQGVEEVDGELRAIGKVEKAAKDLVEQGKYMEGVAKIDSLIAAIGDKDIFLKRAEYGFKFELLAGQNDQKAYDWLRWMLAPENRELMKQFDWDHFVGGVMYWPKYKDYDMQLATIDRCIELAEFKYLATDHMDTKAKILLKRSKERTTREEAARDTAKVLEVYKQALSYVKKSGNDLRAIGAYYRNIAGLEKDSATIRKNNEASLKAYKEALRVYTTSKSPTKQKWYIEDVEKAITKLEQQLL